MPTAIANDQKESIQFASNGLATVVKKSPFSGKFHRMVLQLTDEQYSDWLAGGMIQNVMPHLVASEREFLMTGITPEEWDETFGGR